MFRIIAFIALCVGAYISLTYLALILRFIMGVFTEGTGVFASFIFAVTEPVVLPIRRRLDKIEILQDIPVDISVPLAMVILTLLTWLLPKVV